MSSLPSLLLLGTLAVGTCGEPPRPCGLPYLGDKTAAPKLEVWSLSEQGNIIPVDASHPVLLRQPPQGGRVAFLGIRATNLDSCSADLIASVKNPMNSQIRLDGRTINLVPEGNGWGGSVLDSIDTQANVPLCPNQWSSLSIPSGTFQLTVTVTDVDSRKVTVMTPVTFRCADTDPTCACLCRTGYKLGDPCDTSNSTGDGGTPDAGTGTGR